MFVNIYAEQFDRGRNARPIVSKGANSTGWRNKIGN